MNTPGSGWVAGGGGGGNGWLELQGGWEGSPQYFLHEFAMRNLSGFACLWSLGCRGAGSG